MARVVRKVSNKASKEQKKTTSNNKKRNIWIGSILAGIIVIAAVVVTIILCIRGSSESFHDYLAGEQIVKIDGDSNEYKTSFTKMTYSGVLYHHNNANENDVYLEEDYYKYVFVYAQDFHKFYPNKDKDKDKYSKDDSELLARLARLQLRIDQYNETVNREEMAILYVVDTYYDYNKGIFDDSNFGTTSDDNLTSLFCLFAGNGITENKIGLVKYDFNINDEKESTINMYDTNNGLTKEKASQAYSLLQVNFNNYEKGYKKD